MIVVSDTSCITNLIAIGQDQLLEDLFGDIVKPPAVDHELQASHPSLPDNFRVLMPSPGILLQQLLAELDEGEAEAICLAKELNADRLLIDETAGRAAARRVGVPVMGLLGVLLLAKHKGRIERVAPLLQRLQDEAAFWLDRALVGELLRQAGE